jgi:hypothetical protein
MMIKLTSKNRITLPKSALAELGKVSHFRVMVEGDRLVLTPVHLDVGNAVRRKLGALAITGGDIADAVAWAREKR